MWQLQTKNSGGSTDKTQNMIYMLKRTALEIRIPSWREGESIPNLVDHLT